MSRFFIFLPQIFSVLDVIRYCTGVSRQIAAHLGIYVFSIKSQPKRSKLDWHFAQGEEEEERAEGKEDLSPLLEAEDREEDRTPSVPSHSSLEKVTTLA